MSKSFAGIDPQGLERAAEVYLSIIFFFYFR